MTAPRAQCVGDVSAEVRGHPRQHQRDGPRARKFDEDHGKSFEFSPSADAVADVVDAQRREILDEILSLIFQLALTLNCAAFAAT